MAKADRQAVDFSVRYRDLEVRMRALADSDGDVYLPNPEPSSPVDYVFLGMEPSLGGGSLDSVRAEVGAGARNFVNSMEDFILHFSIRKYLLRRPAAISHHGYLQRGDASGGGIYR